MPVWINRVQVASPVAAENGGYRGTVPETQKETYEDICLKDSRDFEYKPLNRERKEIRLIRIINRGTFEDFLFTPEAVEKVEQDEEFRISCERTFVAKCEIKPFPLDSCPEYAALSYTWGDDSNKRPIFFPDSLEPEEDEYQVLKVTENLFQALRQVKPLEDVEWLWVDAICINLDDSEEKGWQVAQMYDIYNKSKYVMLWLGPGSNGSNKLLEKFNELFREIYARKDEPNFNSSDWRLPDSFDMIEELNQFVQRPYWTRAWVRQARDLRWSHQSHGRVDEKNMDIISASKACGFRMMSTTAESPIGERARLVHILETWLRRIYVWGEGLKATDPRDLVFSLYSMTYWKEDYRKLVPDYTKDCRDVYIDVAKHFFDSQWFNVLAWRNAPYEDDDEIHPDLSLPSFVPDWRRQIRPVHLLRLPPLKGDSELQYHADKGLSKLTKNTPTFSDESAPGPLVLYLSGYIIDTISDVGPIMKPDGSPFRGYLCQQWVKDLESLYAKHRKAALKARPPRPTIPRVAKDLWRIPILDIEIIKGELKRATPDFVNEYRAVRNARENRKLGEMELAPRYIETAMVACTGKRFWVSENGYVGMGFKTVRPGHKVVVIPHLSVPLVLGLAGKDMYHIIGDTYAEGIMYGEMRDEVKAGNHSLQNLNII